MKKIISIVAVVIVAFYMLNISTAHVEAAQIPIRQKISVIATAYCPCKKCCGKADGITKTGVRATEGRTIAVDPSVIPLGSEVTIGDKTYIAEDTGRLIKGNRIDIYMPDHKTALEWGKQIIEIEVKK